MALVGASLGGAIALDFALAYPEAVEKLVLIDAQVWFGVGVDGCSRAKQSA
jgi:pimeloyl-ACP methyl ester carboxylesterase